MSERKKKKQDGPPGTPEWMVTFSDIMSLLVTFFVLLMTFSSFDSDTFDLMSGSLRGAFGVIKKHREDDKTSLVNSMIRVDSRRDIEGAEVPPQHEPLSKIDQRLRQQLEMMDVMQFVDLVHMDRGLVIRIQDGVLFEEGRAKPRGTSRKILRAVAAALRYVPNRMLVEGHTDDTFLPTLEFGSDRALSLARAVVVSDVLIQMKVAPNRIGTAGAGKHKPVLPNTSPEGRARNRRVEVTIFPPPAQGVDA